MNGRQQPFRVASVQAASVFLDREASLEKARRLIAEAGAAGARLAVFPEGFLPTYPFWVWHIPSGHTTELRELYARLVANSIAVPGPEIDRLSEAAREAEVNVVMGINELNAEASGTSLYNSLLYIDSQGELRGVHRKLVPTVGERFVHGQGDGSTLEAYDLDIGRVGGLICWENYMPLARYALYAWGTQIYVAPTWDWGEPWLSTLRHIGKEGRAYVIGACSALHRDQIPDDCGFKSRYLPEDLEWINPGHSAIVDPDGKLVAGPAEKEETILYADIDPAALTGPRYQLDVAGHYGRPDVFELIVDRTPRPMVEMVDEWGGLDEELEQE